MTGAERQGRERIHMATTAQDRQVDDVPDRHTNDNDEDELDAEFERY